MQPALGAGPRGCDRGGRFRRCGRLARAGTAATAAAAAAGSIAGRGQLPFAPGGGTDLVARLLARHLEKQLGGNASIVVLSKPGAGGAIGFGELARAAPDGYTIGFLNTPNLLTIPIERKSTFTWRSFDLIGNLVDDPGAFAVHNSSGIDSLASLAKYAKTHPGEVTVGTTGTGRTTIWRCCFSRRPPGRG